MSMMSADKRSWPDVFRRASPVVFLLACLGLAGCMFFTGWRDEKTVVVNTIALHAFVRENLVPGRMSRFVSSADGSKRFNISHFPIISSRQIVDATLVDSDDAKRPAIRLRLDRHGAVRWLQACREIPGDALAVLVDGFYCCALRVPHGVVGDSILVRGPWSRQEAEAIADRAKPNYRELNPPMFR